MERNDKLLSNLLSNLQAQRSALSRPDETVNNVMARLDGRAPRRGLVLVLRLTSVAASLLLLLSLALRPLHPSKAPVALAYQQAVLSQKHDASYMKGKFFDKTLYDIIKQKYDENSH